MAQVQLRVYRGTLVHSRVLEQIEVLQDYLLGFDENLGEVSNYCMLQCIYSRRAASAGFLFVCTFFFFFFFFLAIFPRKLIAACSPVLV